jgi:hypothetical protein
MPADSTMRSELVIEGNRARLWISAATDRAILRRSVVTCLIVGALLTVINHGDQLLRVEFSATMAWQIGLTFLVPFLVATSSAAAAVRSHGDHQRESVEHSSRSRAVSDLEADS